MLEKKIPIEVTLQVNSKFEAATFEVLVRISYLPPLSFPTVAEQK